tara:strand:+ start:1366 stop:1983 length:618 start_codon:yes stop_codon:yes gene_type:complete
MKTESRNVAELVSNPLNPRTIKSARFSKLVKSIRDFPEMLKTRPIVVDENNMVLGGNMRLKACKQIGMKEVPVVVATDWTNDQKSQFIIKDNNSFGDWDVDVLANQFEKEFLLQMGMEEKQLGFFMEEFEEEFYKVDDTNAELPIVPKFSEGYSAVMIFCDNEMDENWLRNVLKLKKSRDYKTERIKETSVVTVKEFQKLWKEKR